MPETARQTLGIAGEQVVARHLEREGFTIVGANVKVGRLELDLIARRGPLLVFCEVRSRASRSFVDPIDTIDVRKQERIRRAACAWLAQRDDASEVRFDAAEVVFDPRDEPTMTYYECAF